MSYGCPAAAIPRFATIVISILSGIALLIAVVGTYGLLAYTIAQRGPELAIRLALGASSAHVSGLMLKGAMLRVLAGVAAGLMSAWWLAGLLQSLLFGVHPHDPLIFASVAAVLVLSSMVAVIVPSRRVFKINPASVLRVN